MIKYLVTILIFILTLVVSSWATFAPLIEVTHSTYSSDYEQAGAMMYLDVGGVGYVFMSHKGYTASGGQAGLTKILASDITSKTHRNFGNTGQKDEGSSIYYDSGYMYVASTYYSGNPSNVGIIINRYDVDTMAASTGLVSFPETYLHNFSFVVSGNKIYAIMNSFLDLIWVWDITISPLAGSGLAYPGDEEIYLSRNNAVLDSGYVYFSTVTPYAFVARWIIATGEFDGGGIATLGAAGNCVDGVANFLISGANIYATCINIHNKLFRIPTDTMIYDRAITLPGDYRALAMTQDTQNIYVVRQDPNTCNTNYLSILRKSDTYIRTYTFTQNNPCVIAVGGGFIYTASCEDPTTVYKWVLPTLTTVEQGSGAGAIFGSGAGAYFQ